METNENRGSGKGGATTYYSNPPENKIVELRDALVSQFVQRETEITAVLSGLLSGEPTLLVGPPGTAKTLLVEKLSNALGGSYFYYLLTRFTEPDELLGPVDILALREGQYKRNFSGKLPNSDIVFLDEIFKSSSAIRNILLDIILNKRIPNGNGYIKIPLLAFYCASNEISTDSEDQAFFDRLTIRSFSSYVSPEAWEELLVVGVQNEVKSEKTIKAILSKEEAKALQSQVLQRLQTITSTSVIKKYLEALSELRGKGIEISDRRKIKILKITSAISLIYLEPTPSLDSLADALRFSASDADQLKTVEEVIMKLNLSSFYLHIQQINTLNAELQNVLSQIKSNQNPSLQDFQALSAVYKKALAVLKVMPKNPRLLPYIRNFYSTLDDAKNTLNKIKALLEGDSENGK
jgi:MoxR-like ATPase